MVDSLLTAVDSSAVQDTLAVASQGTGVEWYWWAAIIVIVTAVVLGVADLLGE